MGLIDWASGGGRTNVQKYRDWDQGWMNYNRQRDTSSRGDQEWLAQQYRQQMAGNTPSVAQNQLAEATAANTRQQMAMARSGGGGALGGGANQYNAARNAAQMNQDAARQGASLRAQEMQAASQNLGNLYGQQRAQDQAMFGGEMQYEGMKADSHNAWAGAQATADESYKGRRGSGFGGVMAAGAAAFGSSDPKMKTDIQDADKPNTANKVGDIMEEYAKGFARAQRDTPTITMAPVTTRQNSLPGLGAASDEDRKKAIRDADEKSSKPAEEWASPRQVPRSEASYKPPPGAPNVGSRVGGDGRHSERDRTRGSIADFDESELVNPDEAWAIEAGMPRAGRLSDYGEGAIYRPLNSIKTTGSVSAARRGVEDSGWGSLLNPYMRDEAQKKAQHEAQQRAYQRVLEDGSMTGTYDRTGVPDFTPGERALLIDWAYGRPGKQDWGYGDPYGPSYSDVAPGRPTGAAPTYEGMGDEPAPLTDEEVALIGYDTPKPRPRLLPPTAEDRVAMDRWSAHQSGLSSGKECKKQLKESKSAATDWVAALQPKTWVYRDPDLNATAGATDMRTGGPQGQPSVGDPSARRVGVLTTDLRKTPEGASMVVRTPRGDAIDPARATGPLMAAVAAQERRLRALEGSTPPSDGERMMGRRVPRSAQAEDTTPTAGERMMGRRVPREIDANATEGATMMGTGGQRPKNKKRGK